MEFVNATEAHFPEVAQLASTPAELYSCCPSATYPWDTEQIRAIAQKRANLTVCLADGRVVAFGNLYNVRPSDSAFIGNVIVADSHKGQGIGRAMIEKLSAICREEHNAVPCLSVFNYNTRALLLYTRLGFVPFGAEPRRAPDGQEVALIHMRKG